MIETLCIRLENVASDKPMPLLMPCEDGFIITQTAERAIQKAARSLANLGIRRVSLLGEGWSLMRQWHFYLGFWTPRHGADIAFPTLSSAEERKREDWIQAVQWTRRMINMSAEDMTPEALAEEAINFIRSYSASVSAKVIKGEALAEAGYVGLWSVGRGSERPPVLLTLDYNPKNTEQVDVALVGKGITFDSGGYSIKSSQGMLTMRMDMGGAATVTGALGLAIAQGLQKRVRLILCCAENLISGRAYKLGDILTYRNGQTVEIVNTDAEGRLVLADGLIDASQSGAPLIVDAATLTGAAVTAVGTDYNAVFALDQSVRDKFLQTAEATGELHWPLPLAEFHRDACPSTFADTMNSRPVKGGGPAGASNAAGFLSRFVRDNGKGWLHIDLAACDAPSGSPLWPEGGTGHGVRTIAEFLLTGTRD
ncbi:MAG: aminopeptidase PepB [Gammaproteobacteria bacterium]|nr:MAG: aminopeptidase PepB [Gammaproteobacteria bacterium]